MLPQIWYFVSNLGFNLYKNGMIWIIRGSKWLVEAPPIFLMHVQNLMRYFSSNGCVSLQYNASHLSCVDMVPTIYYFVVHNWRTNPSRNGMVWTIRGLLILSNASPNLIMHLRKGMSRISSNGCLSSWHSIPFSVQRCYPKSGILWAIGGSTSTKLYDVSH